VTELSTRRIVAIAAIAGALVGGAVAGTVAAYATNGGPGAVLPTDGRSSVATAPVVRTNLAAAVQVGGSIGYAGSYTVTAPSGTSAQQIAQAEQVVSQDRLGLTADEVARDGAKVQIDVTALRDDQNTLATLRATAMNPGTTYTSLPQPGQTIRQDQPVYGVSDEPVLLLFGSIPAYRAFYVGMSDGSDVFELTHDLIVLGFGSGLTPSAHFSSATAAAVVRWQRAVGLPATGEILLGQVIFEPGPLRVTSVNPSVGASVGGAVLSATSTRPIVIVDLDVSQEYLVTTGNDVSIVLPNGTTTVLGRVASVGSVATCPGGGGIGTGSGGASADQSPCQSGGSGNSATPTVTVTVTFDHTPALARLDQAPVNVNITTQRADHVLAVPVNALLALAGGGFGVDVVSGHATHLVGVTTGLYTSSLVQVSGAGLVVGSRVEVPAP
jgi:peptidoglycan hydrolase-like protein with peptidoglycan-binding domain